MARGLSRKLHFGVLVHEVSRVRRKAIDQVLKPLGITGGQWWIITYISLHDGLSQVALADELNMGKVALGGLIDRLEKNDLIERRADPIDRRLKRIHLSAKGSALVEDIKRASAGVQDAALKGISAEQLECAISALRTMEANLLEFVKTE